MFFPDFSGLLKFIPCKDEEEIRIKLYNILLIQSSKKYRESKLQMCICEAI